MLNISDERRQRLIKEMGLEILPKIIQDEHIEKFEGLIQTAVGLEFVKRIPKDKQKEFHSLCDAKDDDAVEVFVEQFMPGGIYEMLYFFAMSLIDGLSSFVTFCPAWRAAKSRSSSVSRKFHSRSAAGELS